LIPLATSGLVRAEEDLDLLGRWLQAHRRALVRVVDELLQQLDEVHEQANSAQGLAHAFQAQRLLARLSQLTTAGFDRCLDGHERVLGFFPNKCFRTVIKSGPSLN